MLDVVDEVGCGEREDSDEGSVKDLVVEVSGLGVFFEVLFQVGLDSVLKLGKLIHVFHIVEKELEKVLGQVITVYFDVWIKEVNFLVENLILEEQLVLVGLDVVESIDEIDYILEVEVLRNRQERAPSHDHCPNHHHSAGRELDFFVVGRKEFSMLFELDLP